MNVNNNHSNYTINYYIDICNKYIDDIFNKIFEIDLVKHFYESLIL